MLRSEFAVKLETMIGYLIIRGVTHLDISLCVWHIHMWHVLYLFVWQPNHKNAIIRTISHIFCHVICSIEQQTELWKVLTYLEVGPNNVFAMMNELLIR